jgi:hypothetical protein
LVEEPGVPEKTTDLSQVTDQISHNVVSSTPRHERDSSSFGNLEYPPLVNYEDMGKGIFIYQASVDIIHLVVFL